MKRIKLIYTGEGFWHRHLLGEYIDVEEGDDSASYYFLADTEYNTQLIERTGGLPVTREFHSRSHPIYKKYAVFAPPTNEHAIGLLSNDL